MRCPSEPCGGPARTVKTAPAHHPAKRPVRSPLSADSHGTTAVARTRIQTPGTSKSPRDASIADFCDYLRTTNNRNGRPYEEATVENYVYAARALGRWMSAEGIDRDFTVAAKRTSSAAGRRRLN